MQEMVPNSGSRPLPLNSDRASQSRTYRTSFGIGGSSRWCGFWPNAVDRAVPELTAFVHLVAERETGAR